MKSAYELAMEKLNQQSGPTKTLTDDQKARIHEIDSRCDAKVAQAKLTFEAKCSKMPNERRILEGELSEELRAIEADRQREKDAVWNEA